MVIFVIDDEDNAREYLSNKVSDLKPDAKIYDFSNAADALEALKEISFDVAFLDIQMPKIDGIALAKKFKSINPKSNIVFVTGYADYSLDAFSLDASGYLLKPATKDQIEHALENLRYPIESKSETKVTVQCFGNFEIFYKGSPIAFKYNKSKETLAYLVDRKGAMCRNSEVITSLWEDDANHNSYYRSILKDIADTLDSLGCKNIFQRKREGAAIVKDMIFCDYYDFLEGNPAAINAYQGEYMSQYSWAEQTAGALFIDYEY